MARKRRILHGLKIDEISSVDKGAQGGAYAVLMKRDTGEGGGGKYGEEEEEGVGKSMGLDESFMMPRLLTDVDGHSHLIDLADRAGMSTWDVAEGEEIGHRHSWVMNDDGSVTVGAASGHTHQVIMKRALKSPPVQSAEQSFAKVLPKPRENEDRNGFVSRFMSNETAKREFPDRDQRLAVANSRFRAEKRDINGESGMSDKKNQNQDTPSGDVQKQLGDLQKRLERSEAFGALTDAEKAHFSKLSEGEQSQFLKLSAEQRKEALNKQADEDPVIYKSADGIEYRKSADPQVVALAKRLDAATKEAQLEKAAREHDRLSKRAGSELSHIAGEHEAKVALFKAVEGIQDEGLRDKVTEVLKSANNLAGPAFRKAGQKASMAGEGGDPNEELEKLAKRYSEENKVDLVQARADVLNTPEGTAAYERVLGVA